MRTHRCGDLTAKNAGEEVTLVGWVHTRRDHGGVIFIDLRDREGLVQIVTHPEENPDAYPVAEKVRSEYVVQVHGTVRPRPKGAENPNLATGEVEVAADRMTVISESDTPPFPIEDRIDPSEEVRLRYRYLDLRRPEMQRMLRLRHNVFHAIRRFFDSEGFLEVETPVLTKATPEGARDFVVPSRISPGSFWALPQSPQLFKQLLMVGGVDRYYQIARCMRDEDPRADRQPDFTQIDVELSFTDEEEILDTTERMMATAVKAGIGVDLQLPFPRITYAEAISRYGSDKPDLRIPLEMVYVSEVFADTALKVFASTLDEGGVASAMRVPGAADLGRKELDELVTTARNMGAGGLAWVAFREEIASPIAKFMKPEEVEGLREATGAGSGDLVLIVCDRAGLAERALGAVRTELGRRTLSEQESAQWSFVWVVDPPLVEYNEEENRWDPVHHMFTAPRPEHLDLLEESPGEVLARCYDLVLNGWELGTGSIRIHDPSLQDRVFRLIGLDRETVERRFGWFLQAYRYGGPPHGGIALGLDRIVAMLGGKDNIREAIAFPKTGTYTDPLTGAPDALDPAALRELRLKVVE